VKQSHGSKIYFIPQLQETYLADGAKILMDRPIPPMLADYMNRFYKLNPVTIKQFQKKFGHNGILIIKCKVSTETSKEACMYIKYGYRANVDN
jgi:hypothetical protein